jgi:hypothetical protein
MNETEMTEDVLNVVHMLVYLFGRSVKTNTSIKGATSSDYFEAATEVLIKFRDSLESGEEWVLSDMARRLASENLPTIN